MAIILAKTAGFCFGVRRALGMALSESQNDKETLQTYGPLIHNQQVINLLKSKNICYSENINDIYSNKVLIRAHGVAPSVKKELKDKNISIIDATCPHVSHAQKILEKFAAEDYYSIIIGDKGHAEVVGLLGYTKGKGIVIENVDEIDNLPTLDKVCVVAQTTQSEEKYKLIIEKIKLKYPQSVIHNTVCKATSKRQEELKELAKKVDLMVIVGGKKSANTLRLAQLSRESGTPTIHIETADEISFTKDEIQKYKNIGVTAGASTPYWIIRNVVEELEDLQRQANSIIFKLIFKTTRAITYSNILLAFSAAVMTYVSSKLMKTEFMPLHGLISLFYILSMHCFNKYLSLPNDKNLTYGSLKFFIGYQKILLAIGAIGVIGAFAIALTLSIQALIIMILSLFAGIIYSIAIFPESWSKIIRYRSLKAIPGSKDLFSAIGWVIIVVALPFLESYNSQNIFSLIATALIVFSLVFSRSILLDLRDIEGDITIGRETIPVFIGSKYAVLLSRIFLFLAFLTPIICSIFNILPLYSFLFSFIPLYVFLVDLIIKRHSFYHIWYYDALIDIQFLLAAIIGFFIV